MYLFSFDYPPNHGGISRLCGEVARTLSSIGVMDSLITEKHIEPIPPFYPYGVTVTSRRPWREILALLHLQKIRCGIITGIWYPEGLLAWISRTRPLVILAHGLELRPTRSKWRQRLWKMLGRRVLSAADLVLANSQYTAGLVRQIAPKARIICVPLAVDADRFSPGNKKAAKHQFSVNGLHTITTVSRVEHYKGHETLLRALSMLTSDVRQHLIYLIAGRGPYVDSLHKLAHKLGVSENVRFLGFVPEHDLPDLYRATDLFVLCTRDEPEAPDVEGFGLVFLEAQACGTPVVGTLTGGIPDAVEHGKGGWLIEQNDISALAEHFKQLVYNPAYYEAAGRAARDRIKANFTWTHYADRLVKALNDAEIIL